MGELLKKLETSSKKIWPQTKSPLNSLYSYVVRHLSSFTVVSPLTNNQGELMDNTGLPQELVDAIIDDLHDDRSALRTCGLVSRSWLPRTRMHLFRTIRLRNAEGFIAFEKLLKRSLYIAYYAQRVLVVKTHTRASRVDRELPHVLSKLPRVQYLEAECWAGQMLSPDVRTQLSAVCANLSAFHLYCVRFYEGDLIRFLLHCPRLRSLCIQYVFILPDTPDSIFQAPLDSLCTLDTLRLLGSKVELMRALIDAPVAYRLKSVVLCASPEDPPELFEQFLARAGAQTEQLHLMFSTMFTHGKGFHDAWVPYRERMLATNTGLVMLHISSDGMINNREYWSPRVIEGITTALSLVQPAHAHLQSIDITMRPEELFSQNRTHCMDWAEVDMQLMRILRGRPQLKVLLRMCPLPGPSIQQFEMLVIRVTVGLRLYLAGGGRLGIMLIERWEDIQFGGTPIGNVWERWYNVADPAAVQ